MLAVQNCQQVRNATVAVAGQLGKMMVAAAVQPGTVKTSELVRVTRYIQ
jgi:hypothetical protein